MVCGNRQPHARLPLPDRGGGKRTCACWGAAIPAFQRCCIWRKPARVVLLEASRVGSGASGRNGGQIHSGQRRHQDFLEAAVGLDDARKLWALAEESKALVRDLVTRHGIDCDLKDGLILADHKPHYVAESHAYAAHLRDTYGYEAIEPPGPGADARPGGLAGLLVAACSTMVAATCTPSLSPWAWRAQRSGPGCAFTS